MISGGGAMHLNDSFGASKIKYFCNHNEQATAICGEGYARVNQKLALVNVTTGPGGLNCLNGVFGAWTDNGMWKYGVAGATTESEGRFVRKVPVINNMAQIYLPYASDGNLWAECTIGIIGYDSAQNEMNLLQGKKSLAA